MASRTAFKLAIKKLDQSDYQIEDLGDDLIDEALTDALREYSEYVPRGMRTATIEIEVGDTEILLPADCLEIDEETAYLLAYGYSRPSYRVPGAYPARYNNDIALDSINPLSLTTDPPQSTSQADPLEIPRSTSSTGRISILLAEEATAAREHDIRYQAYHAIADGSGAEDTNTVPLADRRKLRQLVRGYMAESRAVQATDPQEVAKWEKRAEKFFQVRAEFTGACGAIG